MKAKISISIEEDILSKADTKLTDGLFRNKSHLIEYALRRFLDE